MKDTSDKKENNLPEKGPEKTFDRRGFLRAAGVTGLGLSIPVSRALGGDGPKEEQTESFKYQYNNPENIVYTSCLGCNTGCPTKVKVQNGVIVKIDGNPYTPWNKVPHIPYSTPVEEAAKIDGHICSKGQSGMMTMYDPHRITKVLKRVGPRGSMRWQTIDFHQAVQEIVDGGKLFAHVEGEEGRHVEGLKDFIMDIDPEVAERMDKAIQGIWAEPDIHRKKEMVVQFKADFSEHLHVLIDPDHPDFGPKNNQFVWTHGRLKGGRSQFIQRFIRDGLGSANYHGHTTVCQGSLYYAGQAMSEQYVYDEGKGGFTWRDGKKFYWQVDQSKAEFIVFVGTSPFEANYPPLRTSNITRGVTSKRLRYVVADPRYSKTAVHAEKWLPIKPGTEGAMAMGMIRWILENERYDHRYLSNANMAAAMLDGEPNHSNACWLVNMEDGKPAGFLRASEIGLPKRRVTVAGGRTVEYDPFIVYANGRFIPFDNNAKDAGEAAHGALFVDASVAGRHVKSVMQILKEEAWAHTTEEWAEISGIKHEDLVWVADEFTSHGKKAACDIHRGVSQHTNGIYQSFAFNTLNLLIGNYDYAGGMVSYSTYNVMGSASGSPYNLARMSPGKKRLFGMGILRNMEYEKSTLFDGTYPAKRPWFPHATDVYQEILPSIEDAYPYGIKAWLLYKGTPVYANPAGHKALQTLADVNKLPLIMACDIVVGTTSMYADYIFPDLGMYERWEYHGSHPNNIWKVQPARNPAINSPNGIVEVFGKEMPISIESFMLAVAEKMKLKGYGKDGFGPGMDFLKPEDFYLKQLANLGYGDQVDGRDAVPDATDEEVEIFRSARRHLHPAVFDFDYWKQQMGTYWRKAVYVLNRGGRYQDYEKAYDGDLHANKFGKQINMYMEHIALTRNSMTGERFFGMGKHFPIQDSLGREIRHEAGSLHLITYKEMFRTKNRTSGNAFLQELAPDNHVLINPLDAERLNLQTGDMVRVVSDSNPEGVWKLPNFGEKHIVGRIKTIEGLRPGVMAFSLGYGNWANGSADYVVDGQVKKGIRAAGTGINANAVMMTDPHLKNVSLQDTLGASVVFYDSPVRLLKENQNPLKDTLVYR
jgi:tetrathionate reductase subunit A